MPRSIPAWITDTPIAHRGLHVRADGIPENSQAAFTAAADHRWGIELDVRPSRDGVAMVFHDATLERVCGRAGRMDALTAAELGRLHLFDTAETIPTLKETLALVGGRVPVLIEVKNYNDAPVGPLERAVRDALDGYPGPYAVQSFSPATVDWFRRHMPWVARGQLASIDADFPQMSLARRMILRAALRAWFGNPDFVGYNVEYMPSGLTRRARDRGLPVLAWTVRTMLQRAHALDHADNLIFENVTPV